MPDKSPGTLDQAALQRLLDISAEILAQLDLDRLLASILDGSADLLDASQINLYQYVADGDYLETWIHRRAPEGIVRLRLQRGEGLAGKVLVAGRGLRIEDYDSWPGRTPRWPKGVTGASMAAPLRRTDELLGILTVSRPPGAPVFTDSDLDLLQLFANQAAVAISNARLYARATRRVDELARLYETSLDVVSRLEVEQVLEATLERATGLLESRYANLRLYDARRGQLVPLVRLNQPDASLQVPLRPGEGLSGKVFVSGEPMIVNDYDHWEGRSPEYPAGSVPRAMGVPLRQAGEVVGVLAVDRPAERPPFTEEDLRLLGLFANQASVAITNARLYADAQLQSQELGLLYETSLDITGLLDLNDLLHAVIRRTSSLIQARQGEILLYDAERDVTTAFLSLGLDEVGLPADIHSVGLPPDGFDGLVIRSGRGMRVEDYQEWPGRLTTKTSPDIGPMLGVPIAHRGQVLGSFSLARAPGETAFTDQDERRLTLFANQAAVAIANSRQFEQLQHFHAQQIEKERLDQQLRMAQAVQAGLLPEELPVIPGWDLAGLWRPALQLGGDYYDLIPLAPDRWAFLMADVSDKGVPAALLMAVARSLFRVYASADQSPRETLARVNHDLVASSHSGMFVTAIYAVADTRTGELRLAAAGHPPALVLRQPDRQVQPIRVGGMPLGILDEAEFREHALRLQPNEVIVLYTDGITEASDLGGEQFGAERLAAFLRQSRAPSAASLIADLDDAVRAFVGEAPAWDDVAYLVIRRVA